MIRGVGRGFISGWWGVVMIVLALGAVMVCNYYTFVQIEIFKNPYNLCWFLGAWIALLFLLVLGVLRQTKKEA